MSSQNKGRTGGVLPINAAVTKRSGNGPKPAQRPPAVKLRLIVRRLPPGLVESEFWDGLGPEWQAGQGSVDWFAFKNGKVSKDPSKPSRPARAYLKIRDQSLIESLSAKIKSTQFKDAKNTSTDPSLIGPPSLEFAPYNKSPSGRTRNDGRQGTIDQDPEFIDFLQSLTEPISRAVINNIDNPEAKSEKVMTTPLVQFIKEKKANKAKEKEAAAAAKTAKKGQEGKESKTKTKGESKPTIIVKSSASSGDKSRLTKGGPENTKPLDKSTSSTQAKPSGLKSEQKPKEQPAPATPAPKKERERGNASAALKLISRDLGLTPKEPRASKAAKNTGTSYTTTNETKAEVSKITLPAATAVESPSKPSIATPTNPTPTGPRNKESTHVHQLKQVPAGQQQRQSKPSNQQTSTAKSAFLKHANPSQGITEDLLRTKFTEFGEITRCEIDKKKGLAYIDFTDAESLKKAISASPVKVANGQVVVLENKSPYRKAGQQRGNNETGNASQGQAAPPTTTTVTSPKPKKAAPAQSVVPATSAALTGPEEAAPTATPSEAPVASRGGRGGSKGSRGGKATQNAEAGKGVAGSRGGHRGGFRGNRGRSGKGANPQNAPISPQAPNTTANPPPPPTPTTSQTPANPQ